jgi:hypothetical protein
MSDLAMAVVDVRQVEIKHKTNHQDRKSTKMIFLARAARWTFSVSSCLGGSKFTALFNPRPVARAGRDAVAAPGACGEAT